MKTHQDLSSSSSVPKEESLTIRTRNSQETTEEEAKSDESSWEGLNPEKRQRALSEFFHRWPEPVKSLSNCLSESELLAAAKEPDRSKWQAHFKDCPRCTQLAELSSPKRVRIPIDELLAESSRIAGRSEQRSPQRSFTHPQFVKTFYKSLRPAQRFLAFAMLLIVVGSTTVFYYRYVSQAPKSLEAVTLPEDKLWKTSEWLAKVNAIAEDSTLKPQEKLSQLKPFKAQERQINQAIAELDRNINETQRAELGTLVATCQNQLKILSQYNGSPNPNAQREEVLRLETTDPSRIVTQVLEAFSSAKNESATNADPAITTAIALVAASKTISITSITASKDVVVYDRLANRSTKEKKEIDSRLQQLRLDGVNVQLNRAPRDTPSSPQESGPPPPTVKVIPKRA